MSDLVININNVAELNSAIQNAGKDKLLILDFWAAWCGPCKALGPVLEAAAQKFAPNVQIVKIDIDKNQQLAQQFRIQSVPAVKFVLDGKLVSEFVGAQPASVVEEYIKKSLPEAREEQNKIEAANSELQLGNFKNAEKIYQAVLQDDPDSEEARLGLAKCFFAEKNIEKMRENLEKISAPKLLDEKENLETLALIIEECAKAGGKDAAAKKAMDNPKNLEAVFAWACCLAADGDYTAAFEALLSIISADRKFRDDEPRKILIALFKFLGDKNPLVEEYRNKLAKILYI